MGEAPEGGHPGPLSRRFAAVRLGWRVLGSNQRRLSRRFYSPFPLTTRATRQGRAPQGGGHAGQDTSLAGSFSNRYPTGWPAGGGGGFDRRAPWRVASGRIPYAAEV